MRRLEKCHRYYTTYYSVNNNRSQTLSNWDFMALTPQNRQHRRLQKVCCS